MPYFKRSFKGPATVTDTGVFSYYRYHFLFHPKLPLRQTGDQTYSFRGVPTDEMTLSFAVEPFNRSQKEILKSLTTVLSAELHDDTGNLVCSASGPLSAALHGVCVKDEHGQLPVTQWVFAGDGYFWIGACTDIKLHHSRSYVLRVKLDQIDPRSPDQMLVPQLEGGGNELP